MTNPMQMLNQFIKFKNSFSGDPKKEVEKLVASGRINQQQLDSLQNMASQFQSFVNQMNK